MVWQTIPDDWRSIAESPTGERPMAIEVETIFLSLERICNALNEQSIDLNCIFL